MKLFTIGHSNHSLDHLVDLLQQNHVTCLVDVRTAPYSRYNPQFNKDDLSAGLARFGFKYIFAGQPLGGRPSDPGCYKSRLLPEGESDFLHEVDYPEVMLRTWFQEGIKMLLQVANQQTTAILCSEEDPAECHRHHLIAKYLADSHPEVEVVHIRGDGTTYGARSILKSVERENANQLKLF